MNPDGTQTETAGVLHEFTIGPMDWKPMAHTPKSLLHFMRSRVEVYGSPLPDGFVPPPGIDLDALLKQVPWPPPADA